MAISFPGTLGTGYTRDSHLGTGNTLTLSKPSGLQDDDYLLIIAATGGSSGNYSCTGFTQIEDWQNATGDAKTIGLFYKYISVASSEGSSYTLNLGQTEEAVANMLIVRGADTSTFQDTTYSRATHGVDVENTNSPNPAAITTATNDAVVVVFASFSQGATEGTHTQPSGYTKLGGASTINDGFDRAGTGAGDARFLCAYKTVASAGSEDAGAWSGLANLRDYAISTIAIRPSTGSAFTLRPDGDGTITSVVNETSQTSNLYQSIDDDPDSPDTSDYNFTKGQDGDAFYDLSLTPGDFSSVQTPITVKADIRKYNVSGASIDVYAQIYAANETNTYTNEAILASEATSDGLASVDLTVNSTGLAASKADWDAARIRIRWDYT